MDEKEQFRAAIQALRDSGVIAVPTDTVYGLLAVAADTAAVDRAYQAKQRDPGQPMPIFVGSIEQAEIVADFNDAARRLAERFWPGALTLVLPKKPSYRTRVAAGGDTIGVRAPADPLLREMAEQLGPLTGTSANIAGREECHTAAEVRAQLGDAVDFIVDAAPVATGKPSTIVDCTQPGMVRVLREGDITREMLRDALAGIADVI
ncbi:MAG TPA: L-threonylcarbamoyladenylate synthase [Rhodanobacteraceae bacterium]|nr:L-threonylcarbamoyladenylate synthase [Rhodanobacteraceae bacterium]